MQKQIINTNQAPAAIGSYSQAICTGNMIYTSGQLPIDAKSGRLITESVAQQAECALQNVQAILDHAGFSMSDIVKTTIFISNMDNFETINSVYSRYFEDSYPARSCVQVTRLPKDADIEIEAIAMK